MKIEKICEYLNEIGIVEYDNINTFLEIYSKLNNKNYTRLIDKLRDTLIIYFNNIFIKNNRLSKLCESIILSFNNYQLILKYRTLNNFKNILLNKIQNRYLNFFLNISLYIQKKSNKTKKRNLSTKKIKKKLNNEKNTTNEENSELISSDDERECTFTPQINRNFNGYKKNANNNIESHIYYSPAFNITSKFPLNNYQNYIQTRNNNYINNIQRDNMNINTNALNYNHNTDNSYYSNYSNYNNLNISQDSRSNRSYNTYNAYDNNIHMQSKKINNDYMSSGLNNNKNFNNDFYYNNINYYGNNKILNNYYDKEVLINYNNPKINRNIYNNNFINQNIQENFNRSDEFFNKEMNHIQKVKDKIQNMKIEKLNKIKEECTFEPKINTNYKSFYPQKKENDNYIHIQTQSQSQNKPPISYKTFQINNNINNNIKKIRPREALETIKENENTIQNSIVSQKKKENKKRPFSEKKKGIKIIEDLSLAKKRRTEKTKKLMKERNYTPKIRKNDKYKDHITMTFEERRLKSIALKNKYKNAKKEEENPINNIDILAPGEMVRFKENNLNDNSNNFNFDNKNTESDKIKDNIKINDNIEDEKEKINNLKNNIEKNEQSDNNVNVKEIEKNKLLLIDRIKGEHKIGFKIKKEEEDNEKKENIENNKDVNQILNKDAIENNDDKKIMESVNSMENEDFEKKLENKKEEFSFSPSGFHSNALKEILENKEQI